MPTKKSRKKTTARPQQIEVVLKIRSLHPSLPAPVAAETVAGSSAELEDHLRAKYGKVRVTIERQKTFPVDPITILVTVGIFIGTRVAGKAVDKLTDATLRWAKGKLKAARVTKGKLPAGPPAKKKNGSKG